MSEGIAACLMFVDWKERANESQIYRKEGINKETMYGVLSASGESISQK